MQPTETGPNPSGEPTVLDWIKSLLRGRPLRIPEEPVERPPLPPRAPTPAPQLRLAPLRLTAAHFRLPCALTLALFGQLVLEQCRIGSLEVCGGRVWLGIGAYAIAAAVMAWAVWRGDLALETPQEAPPRSASESYRPGWLVASGILSVLAFLSASDNTFTLTNVMFWVSALAALLIALWEGDLRPRSILSRVTAWLHDPHVQVRLDSWHLLLALSFVVVAGFRVVRLAEVPPEMVSDHAEKLLDVADVLAGETSIFFPRNTGREALQFYLAAATARLAGTGLTFLTLKIGTVLAGLLTLPFLYGFASEVGGRRAGLAAMLLAGVGYWPNVLARIGLRFPLYPLFVAPALYYLARGLRRKSRNDLLLCGLAVGLGLHGYSPTRVLPLVVAVGVGAYLLHRASAGHRRVAFGWLLAAGTVALVVLLPLLRVAIEMPDLVLYRTLTRVGDAERELPGPALGIFLSNLWNGLRMFAWDNGEVWVIGIPGRPALDWVTGALFHLGVVAALVRYMRHRRWLDLFTLLSIPLLMLPSILSLAFPGENPATNRAGGAIVPVFALAGLTLAGIPAWIRGLGYVKRGAVWGSVAALALFVVAAGLNYGLIFGQYADLYRRSAWNTSDLGRVARGFADSVGTLETAHVVAYPYWVDTRLVGVNAGEATRDMAVAPEDLTALADEPRPQLFLVNPQDLAAVETLRQLFPDGRLSRFVSEEEGHDFLIFWVPGTLDIVLEPNPAVEP